MKSAPHPKNERERIAALRACRVLDTDPEPGFDYLNQLAAEVCQTPIALISLVDEDRQWFKAAHGLEVRQTPRELAFCAHAILALTPFVVEDALLDPRFADNPLVTAEPPVRAYASVPLVDRLGHALGTQCVIDHRPRRFSPEQIRHLQMLAKTISGMLESRKKTG